MDIASGVPATTVSRPHVEVRFYFSTCVWRPVLVWIVRVICNPQNLVLSTAFSYIVRDGTVLTSALPLPNFP